ncbi:MAG: hypothetical protein MUE60_10955 [Candidatus Eisenbacteria bacterium]|nr:hypothetical protein [Candidatus Eisenbacteria bacterium]
MITRAPSLPFLTSGFEMPHRAKNQGWDGMVQEGGLMAGMRGTIPVSQPFAG